LRLIKYIISTFPLSYKQRRFNLFREESEGFAKLITELNQEFDENTTPESIMDIIKSLIGKIVLIAMRKHSQTDCINC